jgi:hypothetical protein
MMIEPTLRTLARDVRTADGALSECQDPAAMERVTDVLATVEDVLGRLATDESIGGDTARRLFTLRDDLSAQLLAAATLEEIELPRDAVVALLRKAAESAGAGLEGLAGPDGRDGRDARDAPSVDLALRH